MLFGLDSDVDVVDVFGRAGHAVIKKETGINIASKHAIETLGASAQG